ncbi:chromosome condensation protein CrcB [Pseudoroseomonas deserti]|uniref:Fluoride-specific ion channel FluC n=1 Tax=Teichococcus deserti TaxID=1817963 RepID=A0A1V2H5D3_9PROT|nr:CrcB family protein [Pseudoroseomonas deserti]ONG55767.1 chromosome condensation protein CrcB [Pseudoroseomonas deserti]
MNQPFSALSLLLVGAGGAAGSILRYAVGVWALAWFGAWLPWGTLAVNVVGSGVIGLLGGAIAAGLPFPAEVRLLAITGVLGGFTTFSAFSLDTGVLWQRSPGLALGYLGATLGLGLGAFALFYALGRRLV